MYTTNIYILLDEHDYVFYVGQSDNTENRLKAHKERFGHNTTMEIIDKVVYPYANFFEAHYISLYRSWGFVLKNKSLMLKAEAPKHSQKWYSDKIRKGEYKLKEKKWERDEREKGELKQRNTKLSKRIKELECYVEEWRNLYINQQLKIKNGEDAKEAKREIEKMQLIIKKQERKIKYLDNIVDAYWSLPIKKTHKTQSSNSLQIKIELQ